MVEVNLSYKENKLKEKQNTENKYLIVNVENLNTENKILFPLDDIKKPDTKIDNDIIEPIEKIHNNEKGILQL